MGKCNKTACVINFIAVFAFTMIYSFFAYGVWMKPEFDATAAMWRPVEELKDMSVLCWVLHAIAAAVIVCLFKKFKKGWAVCHEGSCATRCPIKSGGLCFGFKIGLLWATIHVMTYIMLPMPQILAIKWFIADFVMGLCIGAILGMLSKTGGQCEVKA